MFALVISTVGFLFKLPWTRGYGNPNIIFPLVPKIGIMGSRSVDLIYVFTIYFGVKRFSFPSLGELIQEEVLDSENNRVTRHVDVNDQLYVYHSGRRYTYYKNFPSRMTSEPIWMSDERHKDDKIAISFGLIGRNKNLVDLREALLMHIKIRSLYQDINEEEETK